MSNSTELWLVDLQRTAPALEALEQEVPRLSEDDGQRAARLGDARERRHRRAAYIALRIALERLGGPSMRGVRFARGPDGRPHLPRGGPSFSLSHTANRALIGATDATTIGVDLEQARGHKMSRARREQMLAAAAGLGGPLPGNAASDETFTQAWCRLEACAKASGLGLAGLLTTLGLRGTSAKQTTWASAEATGRRFMREARLDVRDIALPARLKGAIALGLGAERPRLRHFPADGKTIANLVRPRLSN